MCVCLTAGIAGEAFSALMTGVNRIYDPPVQTLTASYLPPYEQQRRHTPRNPRSNGTCEGRALRGDLCLRCSLALPVSVSTERERQCFGGSETRSSGTVLLSGLWTKCPKPKHLGSECKYLLSAFSFLVFLHIRQYSLYGSSHVYLSVSSQCFLFTVFKL